MKFNKSIRIILAVAVSTLLLLLDVWLKGNLLASFSLPSSFLVYLVLTSLPVAHEDGFFNPMYPGEPWMTIAVFCASIPYFYMVMSLFLRWLRKRKERHKEEEA